MSEKQYIPVVMAALAVLLIGWWNPKQLRPSHATTIQCEERVDYKWLALAALVAGGAGVLLMPSMKYLKV